MYFVGFTVGNFVLRLHLGKYIVGFTVENFVLRHRVT